MSRQKRIAEMSLQESLITRKKQEILDKQKTAELAKVITEASNKNVKSSNNVDEKIQNNFSNDGSFLENFKKYSAQATTNMPCSQENELSHIDDSQPFTPVSINDVNEELNATPSPNLNALPSSSTSASSTINAGTSSSSLTLGSLQTIPPPEIVEKINNSSHNDIILCTTRPILNINKFESSNIYKKICLEKDKPTTMENLVSKVIEYGDIYEERFRALNKKDIHPALGFIFERTSEKYKNYRRLVVQAKKDASTIHHPTEKYNNLSKPTMLNVNNINSNSIKKIYLDDDTSESDSDSEYMKVAKERNLNNLKRKLTAAASNNYHNNKSSSTSDSDEFDDDDMDYSKLTNNIEVVKTLSSGSSNNHRQKDKKSRWGEPASLSSSTITTTTTPIMTPATSSSNYDKQNHNSTTQSLKKVTRSDPALLQYARQNFGSVDLSEEDWKKAEEHFKINLLYQDMLKKRQEIERLAKSGKFKYEYDSDEDVTGGTWEHKLRNQEMEATQLWADALTKQSEGKHHIGDFLPPEELKKFMEKYDAQKNNRQPDVSDYKEYKLKEDNIGFQMLQKLGWKEGQGLGAAGSGIIDPVNKATQRENNQGLGIASAEVPEQDDNEYDAYRKRMMLAYRFRPNPLNNPRRAYY